MIKRLTFLLFCLFPVWLFAQDKSDIIPVSVDSAVINSRLLVPDQTEPADHQQKTRYLIRVGMDVLTGSDEVSNSVRFYMTHGHRFTPAFSAGIGIGYTSYNDPMSMIPFFVDLDYRFNNHNTTPYIRLKTGYNFAMQPEDDLQIDSYTGGLLFNPAAGVKINFNRGMDVYFSAGYNIDNSSYQFETWGNRTVNNFLSFRRLSLSTGFVF